MADITANELPEEKNNKIINEDCIEGLKELPDNSVDLIIADPPYFKTIGETWDFEWKTQEDYLEWCKEWLEELSRVSKLSTNFFLFGYFRMLAYQTTIAEELDFDLRQEIIVDKGMQAVSGRATSNYKLFPNTSENIAFFIYDNRPMLKEFLLERQEEMDLYNKEINAALGASTNGGGVWSIYTGDNVMGKIPPRDKWNELKDILDFEVDYDDVAHTFNTEMGLTNVWTDIDFYEEDKIHPTQKPLKLMKRIVKAASNEGDVVLDPFMGSGATAVAAKRLDRNYIGFEIDEEYTEKAREKLAQNSIKEFN